jgi:TonB family protein
MTSALMEEDTPLAAAERLDDLRSLGLSEVPPAHPQRKPTPRRLSLGLFVVLAAGGSLFWLRSGEAEATVAATVPLRFETQRDAQSGEVLAHWNRDASALRQRARLALHIEDGGRTEDVELAPDIVEIGAVTYRPVRDFVRLSLRARDRATGRIVDAASTAVAYLEFPSLRQEVGAAAVPVEVPAEIPPAEEPVKAAIAPPAPFVAPLPAKPRPAQALADAPPLDSFAGAPLGAAPPQRPINAPAPPPAAPRRSGAGKVTEPVLLQHVQPGYPPLARQAHVEGVVHLRIAVDIHGRVVRAEALDGPPPLRAAAADAVARWLYRPALLDGEPVTASLRASVIFRLSN